MYIYINVFFSLLYDFFFCIILFVVVVCFFPSLFTSFLLSRFRRPLFVSSFLFVCLFISFRYSPVHIIFVRLFAISHYSANEYTHAIAIHVCARHTHFKCGSYFLFYCRDVRSLNTLSFLSSNDAFLTQACHYTARTHTHTAINQLHLQLVSNLKFLEEWKMRHRKWQIISVSNRYFHCS